MTDRRFINHHTLNQRGTLLEIQCRFCHIKEKYDKYQHVAPCGCAGPTRYVHRECIERWIRVKFEHVYNHPHNGEPQDFNVFCQVCQQRMEMEFTVVNKLSKYEDFVEKIIGKKILFSTLLLLVTGLIVAVIILTIFAIGMEGALPPKYIFAFAICSVLMVVLGIIFVCNFMIIKSIDIKKVANHKNPIILGKEANLDSISQEGEQEQEVNPYFGIEATKRKQEVDPSLMLESKRDSGDAASSVASKTLTDYVMMKMYRHDEASLKGRSQKQFKDERNIHSRYSKKQPIKETRDQSVQISNLNRQKQNAEMQFNNILKQDKSIQKSVNHIDQEIQKSNTLKNQSIQHSYNQRDVSIQPSRAKSRRIFKEDTSILPQSSVQNQQIQPVPSIPKTRNRIYISEQEKQPQFQLQSQRQRQRQRQQQLPAQIISSGDSKKSQEQFLKQAKPQPQQRLKLRTDRSPIKIRVKL